MLQDPMPGVPAAVLTITRSPRRGIVLVEAAHVTCRGADPRSDGDTNSGTWVLHSLDLGVLFVDARNKLRHAVPLPYSSVRVPSYSLHTLFKSGQLSPPQQEKGQQEEEVSFSPVQHFFVAHIYIKDKALTCSLSPLFPYLPIASLSSPSGAQLDYGYGPSPPPAERSLSRSTAMIDTPLSTSRPGLLSLTKSLLFTLLCGIVVLIFEHSCRLRAEILEEKSEIGVPKDTKAMGDDAFPETKTQFTATSAAGQARPVVLVPQVRPHVTAEPHGQSTGKADNKENRDLGQKAKDASHRTA
ncbi:uncharacterized protein E0L32_005470 [Thyridium curvatum]|uniref:Uncharacterized protein n=1 Tax=Thyridium curvatum TaxID=1093900 RepID=A0A507B5Y1_9PEZI|nr:uncharacterized protein E0L32_005470 [Thyridium curvatum]TPX14506.1 hypothetical protein E0L32_005470 [Thyridium curvatum]